LGFCDRGDAIETLARPAGNAQAGISLLGHVPPLLNIEILVRTAVKYPVSN
jgi:hypothetical protein